MFERFTERSRQVVILATDEALDLGHETVEPEHLLLGLLREEHGLAAQVLLRMGFEFDSIRDTVAKTIEPKEGLEDPRRPLSQGSKSALELSVREALSLGHNYIGTEHILLALVREENGAVRILANKLKANTAATSELIRQEVILKLSGPSKKTTKHQVAEASRTLANRLLAAVEADEAHRKGACASALEQLATTAITAANYLRGK